MVMIPSTSQSRRIGRTNDCVKTCHVEVWFLDLDTLSSDVSRGIDILSEDERRRASAFHADRTGRRFAECRARLKRILAFRSELALPVDRGYRCRSRFAFPLKMRSRSAAGSFNCSTNEFGYSISR